MSSTTHNYYGREYRSLEDVEARIRDLAEKDGKLTEQERDEWNALNELRDEMQVRMDRVRELGRNPANCEAGAAFHTPRGDASPRPGGFDGAMRTLERHSNAGALSSAAVDRVDEVLRGPDAGFGLDAAYIEAAGSEAYERAFAKIIKYG